MIGASQAPKKQQGNHWWRLIQGAHSLMRLFAETWGQTAQPQELSPPLGLERITGPWKDSQLERINDLERREQVSLRRIRREGDGEYTHDLTLLPPSDLLRTSSLPNPTKSQQKLLHGSSKLAEGAERSRKGWGVRAPAAGPQAPFD